MSKTYFVSHNGAQLGPFPPQKIVADVKAGHLSPLDYIYDDQEKDWVSLMEYAPLAAQIKETKPKTPPKIDQPQPEDLQEQASLEKARKSVTGPSGENKENLVSEWYILKGENRFGPFAFTEVIKMLQQKVVFEFDFAWHPGMPSWKRIAEMAAFSPRTIKDLQSNAMPEIEAIFFRRRYRRVAYNGTILIHDNKTVWKGQGVEISSGGAGVVMENAALLPGQQLFLHFKPCDGVPPFNAVCEIVSKKFIEGVKEKSTPIHYGLKFTSVSPNTQKMLEEMAKRSEAA